jgi:Flp pilus assembly protein TadG
VRVRREQRGAAAVELALVLPFLLVLVGGILQFSWYLYAMQSGTSAASDLVRRISVGDCQTAADQLALVDSRLGPADSGSTPVTVSGPADPLEAEDIGTTVEVTVTFETADFHLPVISEFYDATVTRTASARVEDSESTPGGC